MATLFGPVLDRRLADPHADRRRGSCYIISRIGTGLFLFNPLQTTRRSPTRPRIRAIAFCPGLMVSAISGAWAGVTLLGPAISPGPQPPRLDPLDRHTRLAATCYPDPRLRQSTNRRACSGAGIHVTFEAHTHC